MSEVDRKLSTDGTKGFRVLVAERCGRKRMGHPFACWCLVCLYKIAPLPCFLRGQTTPYPPYRGSWTIPRVFSAAMALPPGVIGAGLNS